MSSPLFPDDVLFLQRLLRAEGLYLRKLDGEWGRHTEAAMLQHEARADALRQSIGSFDSRSEGCIATLALKTQREARLYLKRVLTSDSPQGRDPAGLSAACRQCVHPAPSCS